MKLYKSDPTQFWPVKPEFNDNEWLFVWERERYVTENGVMYRITESGTFEDGVFTVRNSKREQIDE